MVRDRNCLKNMCRRREAALSVQQSPVLRVFPEAHNAGETIQVKQMIKKSTAVRFFLLSVLCCCPLSSLSSAQVVANKQQIINQARHGYYDLIREGFSEFQCSVTPNWEALLADERKTDAAGADAAVKTLSQIHFSAKFSQDGKVQLTHNTVSPDNTQNADAFKQIFTGMEQMTSGFFDTWKLFVLGPPFPAVESEYRLEAHGPQYLLTYKEGSADVVTTMGRDFAITDMKVTTPEFDSIIQPKFTKTPKGLLFSAYDATYQSKDNGSATELKVLINYQEVDGLQIIQKLNLSGSYGGTPFAAELAFSDCKVTKKTTAKN